MMKSTEQGAGAPHYFRRLDVLAWGTLMALVWSFAVATFTSAGLLPAEFHGFLHGARVDPQSIAELKSGVRDLYATTRTLAAQTDAALMRLAESEAQRLAVTTRLDRLEQAVPALVMANSTEIDPTVTGSTTPRVARIDVPGGSVEVTQIPLGAAIDRLPSALQAKEPKVVRGIALGGPLDDRDPAAEWSALVEESGTLLLGLRPLVSVPELSGGERRIIVGPVVDSFTVKQLCQRLDAIGIACTPVPYTGTPIDGTDSLPL